MCRKRDALPEASKGLAYGIKSQSREQGLSGTDVDGEEGAVREQEQEKTRKAGQGTKTRGSVLGKTAVEVRGGCVRGSVGGSFLLATASPMGKKGNNLAWLWMNTTMVSNSESKIGGLVETLTLESSAIALECGQHSDTSV